MDKRKCIIAGSRTFNDYKFFASTLNKIFKTQKPSEIISGGCRGTDTLAAKYAIKHKIPFKVFPADWNKYGKAAGPIRNIEMAEYGDYLIAFLDVDSKSRGTRGMIKIATEMGLDKMIVEYKSLKE